MWLTPKEKKKEIIFKRKKKEIQRNINSELHVSKIIFDHTKWKNIFIFWQKSEKVSKI